VSRPYDSFEVIEMGLRRIDVRKDKRRLRDSWLLSILNLHLGNGNIAGSEVSLQDSLSYQDPKSVREAMLEAEFRKAEALALSRRYLVCR